MLPLIAILFALAPHIDAPSEMLHDAPLAIRVTGLSPAATYTIQAERVSHSGTIWRSATPFTAGADGVIALPDPLALFASMANTKERDTDASRFETSDRGVVTIAVRDGDKTIADQRITLLKRGIGISTTEIRQPVVGALYAPYGAKKLPGIIVLGGSEGGIPRELAALVASHGYVTFAAGYFGLAPLPKDLDRVPLESIIKAVEWLAAQPGVDANRIGIIGGSKGAELALLVASHTPRIKSVIAFAPSSVAYESITDAAGSTSSWTFGGKELAYAPYARSDAYKESKKLIDLYVGSLAAAPPESEIEVEKINGPVLLISGKQDQLWPSAAMADRIAARSRRLHAKYAVENVQFDDAGHHAAGIPYRATADSVRLGGTAIGIAHAQVESWKKIVEFLERTLGQRPTTRTTP